ncbi:hypothetical protein [Bradyrhizobium sp. 145]|uniref:hypothetical protein n=1 Tax=Bradyrhizobium sp. 145 TaxID=2782621 RepID=UPI001FF96F35|nr:hypothetical protein [Bradyrhizobium sp. 145]
MQVQVDDILQITPNRFSAYEHTAWRHPNGVVGKSCSHGIDVFAIVCLGKILLQVGILVGGSLLSGSNIASRHQ